MNAQLICDGNTGRAIQVTLEALDDSGRPFPAHGTATIDNYTKAFVEQLQIATVGVGAAALAATVTPTVTPVFEIKSKITKVIGDPTDTVTATFNMVDSASGIALPAFSVSVDLVAPVAPTAIPQKATHIANVWFTRVVVNSTSADPGSATVPAAM